MMQEIFLMPLLVSFVISTLLLVALTMLAKRYKLHDVRTSERHMHKNGVSRFGGIALIVAFVLVILLDKRLVIGTPLMGVLFGSMAILILGVIDDVKQMSWKVQLFFQLVIVMSVYVMGVRLEYITNPLGGIFLLQGSIGYLVGFFISIVWVVFLMNAMNWVDGIDGMAGGITLIGAATVFFLSLRPEINQPPIGIITMALIGSLVAFIILNFYPAKILAGTSGALFMGFILAIISIFAGAKIATTMLVLVVPIIDAVWVTMERFASGDSIFSPDKRHLHFRLMELGWSKRKICIFYYFITGLVALVALNTRSLGKATAILVMALIMFAVLVLISRKVKMKKSCHI